MPSVNPFVFLALAIAVFVIGVVVVIVFELVRNVRQLTSQISATTQQLVPLTDELQSELAVTSVEVEGLTRAVEQVQKERSGRARRRKPRAKG